MLHHHQLPPLVAAMQRAYDDFIEIFPDSKSTAQFRYEAASLSQRYIRFNDSEARYVAVLDNHCSQNIAINAGYAIIDAHVVRGDLEGTRTWTEELASRNCGSDEERAKFAGERRTIGNAVRFQDAPALFDAGAFAAAEARMAQIDAEESRLAVERGQGLSAPRRRPPQPLGPHPGPARRASRTPLPRMPAVPACRSHGACKPRSDSDAIPLARA